jgi:hypothetical protein
VLARRVAVAAWRLARADRIGLALIRDGNGTRSFETLLRYCGAAMAEFWRALKTLKALQAEQALAPAARADVVEMPPKRPRPPAPVAPCAGPDEPERAAGCSLQYAIPDQPLPRRTLHEPVAPWLPKEPDAGRRPNEPEPNPCAAAASCQTNPNLAGPRTRAGGTGTPARDHTDSIGNAGQVVPGSQPITI